MSTIAPEAAPPPAPPPRRGRAGRVLAIVALVVLALFVALAAGLWWIFATSSGARFVLGRAGGMLGPGARVEGVEGRLGGVLRVKAIEIDRPELYVHVDDVELDTAPFEPLRGRLLVHRLLARNVEVRTASTGEAAKLPATLKPPFPVELEDGRVGTLRLGAITAAEKSARDAAAKAQAREAARTKDLVVHDVALKGGGDLQRWRIDRAAVATELGVANVTGTVDNATPYALDVKGTFEGKVEERALRLAAKAKGTLNAFEADVDADVGGTRATARATVEPFASVPLKHADVSARDLDLAQVAAGLPRTRLDVEARIASAGGGFAGPVRIENREPGPWDAQRLPFASARGDVAVAADRHAEITNLAVALAGGGTATGRASVRPGNVEARLRVADVDLAALHRALQKTRMSGTVAVDAAQGGQRFEVALKDPRFEVTGRATLAGQRLDVPAVSVRTGGGAVTGKGQLALQGAREFRFEGRAEHFDPSAFVKTTAADLNFTFTTTGKLEPAPAGELRAVIAPSRYAGLPASGRIYVAGDKQRIAASDVHLVLGDGRFDVRGSFGGARDAMDMELHAPNLSTLAKPFGVVAAGRLDAEAHLTGTWRAPAGRVALRGENLALPTNVRLRDVTLRGEAGVQPDSPIDVTLSAHGVALGAENPPTPFAQSIDATVKGTRLAHRLQVRTVMTEEATLTAVLQGGLEPRAATPSWKGRVESLALTGRGAFSLAQPAVLEASASRVELGDALLQGTWGEAHFVVSRWTPRSLDFRGTSPRIVVQNLARSLRLGPTARSDLVIAGDWDIHATDTFDGRVDFHRTGGDLRVGDPPLPLGLSDLAVTLVATRGRVNGEAHLAGARIGRVDGRGNALIVRGAKGWQVAPDAPLEARLVADVPDLEAFAAWLGPDAKVGGRLDGNITVSGNAANPRVGGVVHARDLVMREPQTGFELEQGQAALRLEGHTVAIDELRAVTPWHPSDAARAKLGDAAKGTSGTITAQGSIDFDAHRGAIRIAARQVPVTQVPRRFVVLSGDVRLEANPQGLVVAGNLQSDAGWVGALETAPPSVSDDVVVIRAQAAPAKPRTQLTEHEPITLDVTIDAGEHTWFQGRGLDTRLVGRVHVTGDPANLRATGAVRTEGGTYNGYGQKLTIERGILQFAGPVENPQLDVRAMRKGLAVEAGVEVQGTVAHPRVRLVSVPNVPEPEKLSWLVLGRGPSDLAPGDASVLLSAASSMLGRGEPGQDFAQKLGFDEVKVGRTDTNSVLGVLPESTVAGRTGTASASEVVTVGRSITRDVHLTYQQGLSDAEGTLKLAWQISRRFQLIARAGYLPGLDAVYRWTFP